MTRCLFILFFSLKSLAASLVEADAAFDKRQYAEALESYQTLLKDTDETTRLKALYRAVECEALLFRYAAAVVRVYSSPLPSSPLWKGRLLLLRAEMARHFLTQYPSATPSEAELGSNDWLRQTSAQWHERIDASFEELRALASQAKRPLSQETYFIESRKADPAYSNVLDYWIERASDYYLTFSPATPYRQRPTAESFLSPKVVPAGKAAAQQAFRWLALGGDFFLARRYLIPALYPDRVILRKGLLLGPALHRAARDLANVKARAEVSAEAAQYYQREENFSAAVQLCETVEKQAPGTQASERCFSLRRDILLPRLSLLAPSIAPRSNKGLKLNTRNVAKVFFRLYPTQPEELMNLARKETFPGFHPLRRLSDEALLLFLSRESSQSWEELVSAAKPHAPVSQGIRALPPLTEGTYVLVAATHGSFSQKEGLVVGVPLNVTRLGLVAVTGWDRRLPQPFPKKETKGEGFSVFAVDTETGEPVRAELSALLRKNWNKLVEEKKATDSAGRANFGASVARSGINWSLDVLARRENSRAWLDQELPLQFYSATAFDLYVETDRPIYRPGQTVQAKLTVLKRRNDEFEAYHGSDKLKVEWRDASNEIVHEEELQTNSYGSASFQLTLPSGRLLGQYNVSVTLTSDGDRFVGQRSFAVEQYKRPEMELTLGKGTGQWLLGKPATVQGEAKYFFGQKVNGAKVRYRIYREGAFPWPWWQSRLPHGSENLLVEEGETTSRNGSFSLTFTPIAEEVFKDWRGQEMPVRFRVEVEGRDAGGRTVSAQQTYTAARSLFQFDIRPETSFVTAEKPVSLVVKALNANNQPFATTARWQLFRLEGKPAEGSSLEAQFEKVPDGKPLKEGMLASLKDPARLSLQGLPEGIYRLKLSSSTAPLVEQTLLLPVVRETPSLVADSVSLTAKSEYQLGDTAEVLIGSSILKGKLFVQYWRGEELYRAEVLPGGVRRIQIPLKDEFRPGLTVRWFGAYQYEWRQGEVRVPVLSKDKELSLSWQTKENYEPGEKAKWQLLAKSAKGKGVDGEALVRVYDRALEAYSEAASEFRSELYEPRTLPILQTGTIATREGTELFTEPSRWNALLKLTPPSPAPPRLDPPYLRSAKSRYAYRSNYGLRGGRMAIQAAPESAELSAAADDRVMMAKELSASPAPATAARQDFSETALFLPQLELKDGSGSLSFKFPDSLTSWRATVGVLTTDGKWAFESRALTTSKDFMARLILPRFAREQDSLEILLLLDNQMDKALEGKVSLSIKGWEKDLKDPLKPKAFTIYPRSQARLSWPVSVPRKLGPMEMEVIADAGNYRDTEKRSLVVLPAKERLVDSRVVAFDEKTPAALAPPRLPIETSILQVDPQVFSALLASLPRLVETPSSSTDAVLYRWLPLSLMQSLFARHPQLKQLAGKLPKRTTPLPSWESQDPRRQMLVEETPWTSRSQGAQTENPTMDLLDAKRVAHEEEASLATLRSYQLSDGAFPWYPGGEADFFVTLSVLGAMAEARAFDVKLNDELVKKAFSYVLSKFNSRETTKKPSAPLALYAAYVLSAYFDGNSWAEKARSTVQEALDTAMTEVDALTPLGKAYAAWAYRRLGDEKKSDELLTLALGGSREDAVIGVYWQPEAQSWLWYHDSLDKHAFFLRTLLQLRPDDRRVPGLIRWLLFSRKGNSWTSPRAAIQATFALAQSLSSQDSLDVKAKLAVSWPPLEETRDTDWDTVIDKPWRWTKNGEVPTARVSLKGKGIAFASLTSIFSSENPPPSKEGLITLERLFFKKVTRGWSPLKSGDTVKVGDEIQVQHVIKSRSAFEYLQLRSPRGAGFEAKELLSGYRFANIGFYQEPRDSLENFYFSWIPHGEYRLVSHWYATHQGQFRIPPARLQSVYAPEFAAYASGFELKVTP